MSLTEMWIFIPVFLLTLYSTSILGLVGPLCHQLHLSCIEWIPTGPFQDLQQAFVCGKNIESREHFLIFQKTGLLHIIVVSGSHLIFLKNFAEKFFCKLPYGSYWVAGLLLVYAMVCRLEPPIFRVLIQYFLQMVNRRYSLNYSSTKIIFLAGMTCIALNPHWVLSYSLQMSWLAAMAINLSRRVWQQSALCYFSLLPIISGFSFFHPLTILINTLLAPLFGGLLFPITLLGLLIPLCQPLSSGSWWVFVEVISWVAQWLPEYKKMGAQMVSSLYFRWAYLLLVHALIVFKSKSQRLGIPFPNLWRRAHK